MEWMTRNVACSCILTTSRNFSILVSISPLSLLCGPKNLVKLGILGILKRMHGRNSLKSGMLIYPDHIQTWLSLPIKLDGDIALVSIRRSIRPSVHTSREWVIKFNSYLGNRGHRGPCSPYKPWDHSVDTGIIIFPDIDNTLSTGHK